MRVSLRAHAVLAAAAALILFSVATGRAAPSAAALFAEKCSACHTVGGGDGAGPDLINAVRLAPADLHAAVKGMEANTGPLSGAEVDTFVALLRDPGVKSILAGDAQPVTPLEPVLGSPENGRKLFFGSARLHNGGMPCFACHAVGGNGGNLAKDLSTTHGRIGSKALVTVTEKPPFPMMASSYATHPVTTAEALDLAAFLRDASTAPQEATASEARVVHGAAGGMAAAVLACVAIVLRARRSGMRSRMVAGRGRR